ncbi:MAG: hypothetical protein JWM85_3526 [Acidimicrobiaceae bacterium]|nr:hypothetical protein [Acidimicrobiaceae bacterium]
MHELAATGDLLATFSKHDLAGLIAIIVGVVLLGAGLLRVMGRVAVGAVVPIIGLVVLIIGILFITRTI